MAVTAMTPTTGAVFIPEVWATDVLESLLAKSVAINLVDRKFERALRRGGDIVHIPSLSGMSASKLTGMAGTLTFSAPTESDTTLQVDTLAYVAFAIEDALAVQATYELRQRYTRRAGQQLALTIDSDIWSAAQFGITQSVGTDGVALQDSDVRRAIQYLDEANADTDDRFLVVSPATKQDLLAVERYANSLYQSIANLNPENGQGFFGHIYDLDVYMSNNLPAGTDGKVGFCWQRECVALVVQEDIQVSTVPISDQLADAVRIWTIYGVGVVRADHGVQVLQR